MIRGESLEVEAKSGVKRRARRANPASVVLGVLTALLVGSTAAGVTVPLISGDRTALYALVALGFAMCAIGPLRDVAARARWLSWAGVLGVLLGIAAMGIVVAAIAGIELPLITDERAAFTALTAVIAAKAGVGVLYRLSR